ncbi:hypothetical protein NAPIS_ORF01546 [Vairimorpha apis BRL 01]|uniref:Uncharacterized protein n=1 Tax=Vairimorpha apis BRL 01 TaxID=1037528 RepID=T0L8L7_9MICR|nr:hypothetical protein NAPIS_ORF01546 [Vairimorpha apis BRL 01]
MTNRLPLMLLKQQIINVLYKSHIPSKIEHPQLHNNKDDYTNEDLLNICKDKYYIELEIEIKSVQNKNNNLTIKAVDYLTKNNYVRQNLLKTRIKPKYTLEEFGIKLAKKINNRQLEVVSEDKEETIESLRFKDELKDEMHFSKGNTDNKS